ncbi:MAG: hypothetical protein ACKO9Q_30125, partial [Pirellula sp.]
EPVPAATKKCRRWTPVLLFIGCINKLTRFASWNSPEFPQFTISEEVIPSEKAIASNFNTIIQNGKA